MNKKCFYNLKSSEAFLKDFLECLSISCNLFFELLPLSVAQQRRVCGHYSSYCVSRGLALHSPPPRPRVGRVAGRRSSWFLMWEGRGAGSRGRGSSFPTGQDRHTEIISWVSFKEDLLLFFNCGLFGFYYLIGFNNFSRTS